MPSPFAGMNPYLEQNEMWHDFHERFIPLAAEIIGAQVRPNYIVKIDEHVYIHELPAETRFLLGRADVSLTRSSGQSGTQREGALLEAPLQVTLPEVDLESVSLIEIRDRQNRQLVTVVELLSPSNKEPGPNREQYLAKRAQLLQSAAHFLEIDLLRGGSRMPIDDLPPCDYYVMVSRAPDRPHAGVWPLSIRDRLPVIPIPLRAPDSDAALDLQAALDRVYDAAGYETYIYSGQPQPALSVEDGAWAEARSASQSRAGNE